MTEPTDAKQDKPLSVTVLSEDEIRRAIRIGIDQADRGNSAPLDVQGTLAKVRSRRQSLEDR